MAIEAADLFSKHIEQSRFEDFDNETINKIKIFLITYTIYSHS